MRIDPGANHGVGVAFTDRHGGVSTGSLGSFNLGRTDVDEPDAVRTNVSRLASALGVDAVVVCHQVHGDRVWQVTAEDLEHWGPDSVLGDDLPGGRPLEQADAMVTTCHGVALAIRVADCMPVALADPRTGVIAMAHAGRTGFLAGVLERTVEAMRALGATEILGWIGPHICGRCYEVPEEMAEQAAGAAPATAVRTRWGTPGIDLGAGALAQLESLGVEAVGLDPCTYEHEEFFSHRRDPGAGRLVGAVWMP